MIDKKAMVEAVAAQVLARNKRRADELEETILGMSQAVLARVGEHLQDALMGDDPARRIDAFSSEEMGYALVVMAMGYRREVFGDEADG